MANSAPAAVPMVELRGVRKTFGETVAVDNLDLVVPRGSTYGLLGPNGAGKTTTIRMLLRILEPDAGELLVMGSRVTRPVLDQIGYLPEERGIYRRMRVRRLLAFFAEIKGIPKSRSGPILEEWLERLDLADRANAKVQELSKGMQQKLQFVISVLHDPQIIILDEPFSGLDVLNQQVLRDIVVELKRREKTIIFCTHMLHQAERICDHVCILARGAKVVDGELDELKRQQGGGRRVHIQLATAAPDALQSAATSRLIRNVHVEGRSAEVTLAPDASPRALLAELVSHGVPVESFVPADPSLEEIFIEHVGASLIELEEEQAQRRRGGQPRV